MKHCKLFIALLFLTMVSVSASGQKRDSLAVVRAPWSTDTIDGLVLKRYHFNHKDCLGSNQYICVLEVPVESRYQLAFSYEPRRTPTSEHARKRGAVAAINGSFFDMGQHFPICYLRIDGKEMGENTPQQSDSIHRKYYQYGSVALRGGRPIIFIPDSARNAERSLPDRNIMTAGPLLVYKGRLMPMRDDKTFVTHRHNRTAIGVKRDGTVLLVTMDGRMKESEGMSLQDFQRLLRYLGCYDALNMDGGGSTTMYVKNYPNGGLVSHPTDNGRFDFKGERGVSNCILVLPKK